MDNELVTDAQTGGEPPQKRSRKLLFSLLMLIVAVLTGTALWLSGIFSPALKPLTLPLPPRELVDPAEWARLHPPKIDPASVRGRAQAMDCDLTPAPLNHPTKFQADRPALNLPMLSLALDETGSAPAAPPLSQTHTLGWYNLGPQVGASKGKAVLTGHTYSDTVGIGNQLLGGLVKPGDIIKVSDAAGNNACYRYRDQVRIDVNSYDPDSNLVYDEVGKPQIAIVVCDNFQPATNEWLAREVFYADLLTEENVDSFDK
ncbi:MAG: class F sortase [Actinomycetaceae bacterium]|nr:class F sortase [Actinomycetaceae bacterium]